MILKIKIDKNLANNVYKVVLFYFFILNYILLFRNYPLLFQILELTFFLSLFLSFYMIKKLRVFLQSRFDFLLVNLAFLLNQIKSIPLFSIDYFPYVVETRLNWYKLNEVVYEYLGKNTRNKPIVGI